MLKFFQEYRQRSRLRKQLLAFWDELGKNLERYHVMDQRQFIDMEFDTAVWQEVKDRPELGRTEALDLYVVRLEDFNTAFRDYKEYERWYVSDLKNKTPENAKILHGKKHDLDKKLVRLDLVIMPVREWLYGRLMELKIVK